MLLYIRTLTGKQYALTVEPLTTTIGTIKCQLFEREGFPTIVQRIIFRGHELDDDDTLESHGILYGDVLFLVLRTREEVDKLFQ